MTQTQQPPQTITQFMLDNLKNEQEILIHLGKIERSTLRFITKNLIENLTRETLEGEEVYCTAPGEYRLSIFGYQMAALKMIHEKVSAKEEGPLQGILK
ncbi:MAG: hypothetical protein GY754_00155 [bacterium]|nr:hypothetical protein [bacterium]